METLKWKERVNEFKEIEYYTVFELPKWINVSESNSMTITINEGIFNKKVFVSKFWAFNRGVIIISEHENLKDLEQVKQITIKRLKELFNI